MAYTYDPVDGQAYAKKDAEYPAGHEILDDDYLFPAEKKTTKFTFENNWNDAGIEEIFLVLDPGSILSYVVHKSLVDEPRYQILETKTSAMKKKLHQCGQRPHRQARHQCLRRQQPDQLQRLRRLPLQQGYHRRPLRPGLL